MEIRFGPERTDFGRVHKWLASSYWSPGIARDQVENAAHWSSLVCNAYEDDCQVGYLRVISDRTTFAWICDVFVDAAYRHRGIASAMIDAVQRHPEHQGLRRWVLATRDAHSLYEKMGYEPLPERSRWMVRVPQELS